ncbi:MAG: HAD family hydrolase [Planctomycetota bacterium]|jgi:HAD superfamily hydrolase (TIGR01549 family)
MKVNAVIFDLDGTLTEPILDFDRIRSEMGLLPEEDILAEIEKMEPARQKRALAILAHHEQYAAEHSQLNDGASELLAELRERNLPIGLLTRNTRENTLSVARRHNLDFDAIVARQDGPAKPNAYGVLELCRQFNARPAETLVVGDFLHDLLCARNAGAVAVLMKTHPQAENYKIHADYTISHMNQLPNLIDKLERN